MTRLPASANCTYWPLLTTKSTKRSENGLRAENTIDIGFLRNQRTPVRYAMSTTCLQTRNKLNLRLIMKNCAYNSLLRFCHAKIRRFLNIRKLDPILLGLDTLTTLSYTYTDTDQGRSFL